jgi:hypothetical protein
MYHLLKNMPQPVWNAPDGGANGGSEDEAAKKAAAEKAAAEKAAADKAAADKAAADEAAKKSSEKSEAEALAKLQKDASEKAAKLKDAQEALKKFDGVDPEEYRKLKQAQADAEKAAAEAKGDFERVKQMMAEEHQKQLEAIKKEAEESKNAVSSLQQQINDLTIGNSFMSSPFIKDELVLTPTKARSVYGANFEIEEGKIVAYDKPAGQSSRTKLVDASGTPLAFEDALKKLVETDPDRDHLLRSKMKPGADSKTTDTKVDEKPAAISGVSRIQAALAARKK